MAPRSTKSPSSSHIVALALDNNMVHAFFVLLHALQSTARKPFSVVVGHFTGRLTPEYQDLIRACADRLRIPVELRELTPHPLFTERRHLTITTFSKFVISDSLSDQHLWIDLDTVTRPGWDEFFDHFAKAPASASLVVAQKLESPHTRFEGFNAGVLGWTAKPREAWMDSLASLPEKRFSSEQHLFNTLYANATFAIDVKFNFLSSWHAHTEELERSVIIHFSGPIKPWHLAFRHREAWREVNPSWSYWFEAEKKLFDDDSLSPLRGQLRGVQRRALFSGRLHTGKGALAGWVLRFLAIAGPLGDPLVWMIRRRSGL